MCLVSFLACHTEESQVMPVDDPHAGMDFDGMDLASIPGHEGHENLFQSKDKLKKQIEKLEQALEKDPQNVNLMLELSKAYIHSDLTSQALTVLQKAYGINKTNPEIVYTLAILFTSFEQYPAALAILEPYIQQNANNAKVLSLLADTYRNMNKYEQAIESYKKLLTLNADDLTARYNIAVTVLILNNDIKKALEFLAPLEKKQDLLSENESAMQLLTLLKEVQKKQKKLSFKEYFFNKQLGNIKFDEGNYVEAISLYAKALNEIPFDASTLIDQGISYRRISDYVSAQKSFQDALTLYPKNPEALFNLGIVIIIDLKKKEEGIRYWQKLMQVAPYFAGTQHLKERIAEVLQGNLSSNIDL